MSNGIKSVIQAAHEAIIKNDVEKLLTCFTADASITDAVGTLRGHDGVRTWIKWLYKSMSKVNLKETGLVIEGDKAAHEYVFEGTTPEGVNVNFSSLAIYEFKDEKIQSLRDYFDILGIAKQMAKGYIAKKAISSIEKQFKQELR